MKRYLLLASCLLTYVSAMAGVRPGPWNGAFFLNDSTVMPFRFEIVDSSFVVNNAEERLHGKYEVKGDSMFVQLPYFDAVFHWKVKGDTLTGVFINNMRKTNKVIRCQAVYGKSEPRVMSFELADFSGRWHVIFAGDEAPLNHSVGEFVQRGNHLTGTFLTSTGDYRFLEGFADGTSFDLSTFNGGHVFYFTASLDGDTLRGHYYSGVHWHDTWIAWRDDKASLPDPDSLAFLRPGFTSLSFTFPDEDSALVSFSDSTFKGMVVLVQLMGSWCPNCLDESAVLVPLLKKYKSRGLEIVALDFERIDSFAVASRFIRRFKAQAGINYPVLFAGSSDYKKRSQALPQLTSIIALPTLIYCDRQGRVRKIHTGFSGPATGKHFVKWQEDFERFVERLLEE